MAAMKLIIMKILEYPLGATILLLQQCNRLVKPIHDLVLLRCKICWNIPLAIKYGPREIIGLGLTNLFYLQGIEKLVTLLEEIHSNHLFSSWLRFNYETVLITVGVGEDWLFHQNYSKFGSLLLTL